MVKANFDIPADEWRQFTIKVVSKEGSQKKADVIRRLVKAYTEGSIVV